MAYTEFCGKPSSACQMRTLYRITPFVEAARAFGAEKSDCESQTRGRTSAQPDKGKARRAQIRIMAVIHLKLTPFRAVCLHKHVMPKRENLVHTITSSPAFDESN